MKKTKKNKLHRCSECGEIAKYLYMPSGKGRRYFCELHVPRGCSCNVNTINEWDNSLTDKNILWWNKEEYERLYKGDKHKLLMAGTLERKPDSFYFEALDHNGMRNHCCEYDYSENGFEIDENVYIISKDAITDVIECLWRKDRHLPFTLKDKILTTINNYNECIRYDRFMQKIYNICYPYTKGLVLYNKNVKHFFDAFKSICQEHKTICYDF